MFDRLSFDELAKLYGSLSDLEKAYGVEATKKAIKEMSEKLDGEKIKAVKLSLDGTTLAKQIKMDLPFESSAEKSKGGEVKRTRVVKSRRRKGENERKIREYCKEKFSALTTEQAILSMYYQDGLSQSEIANKIGVNQRAISTFLNDIPEKTKRKIMTGWGK